MLQDRARLPECRLFRIFLCDDIRLGLFDPVHLIVRGVRYDPPGAREEAHDPFVRVAATSRVPWAVRIECWHTWQEVPERVYDALTRDTAHLEFPHEP